MSQTFFEMLVVFGTGFAIVFTITIGFLINSYIKRKYSSSDLTKNKEFLNALRQFKEKTDKRLSHLEAIVTDDDSEKSTRKIKNKDQREPSSSIEIEIDEQDSGKSEEANKLRNMLNQ